MFILFLVLTTFGMQSGVVVDHAEFTSLEACKKAGEKLQKDLKSFGITQPKYSCVEK